MAQMVKSLSAMQNAHNSIPESGRWLGEGHSNPLQSSFLENPMDRGAWILLFPSDFSLVQWPSEDSG